MRNAPFSMRRKRAIASAEHEIDNLVWLNRRCDTTPETNDLAIYEALRERGEPIAFRVASTPEIEAELLQDGYEAARVLLEKYGVEAIVDEVGLAFLEGKLSALRWVLGEDWDQLDT